MASSLDPTRGERKVTDPSAGRLEEREISHSLASTVALPSPSVRRSARIRDSPVISYRDSQRNSSLRDSRYSKKRIFGLDNTDLDLSKQFNNDSLNISQDGENTELTTPDTKQRTSFLPKDMSKMSQVLIASFILVLAILLAEQSLHLLYFSLCWATNLMAGLRLVAFSLPEIFSPQVQQPEMSSVKLEEFMTRVQSEMVRLDSELGRLRDKEKNLENDETTRVDDDTYRIEVEKLKVIFQEYQNTESIRSKDVTKLGGTFDSLTRRLEELEWSNVTLTLEKTLDDIRQQLVDWRSKTETDSGFVKKQLKEVFDKYSDLPKLEESIKELDEKTTQLKLELERKEQRTDRSQEANQVELAERLDWASAELGARISVGEKTRPYLGSPQTEIAVFGLTVWRQFSPLSSITRRPHPGHCWSFSGSRGSVVLNTSKPINLDTVLMDHPNSVASPRLVTITDLSRDLELLTVEYQLGGRGGKVFRLTEPVNVHTLRFTFLDNWGEQNFTCLGKIGLFEDK